jgi:hypothetical protein
VNRPASAKSQRWTYPDPGRAITRSSVLPWNSRRFRRTWRCQWCRRPAAAGRFVYETGRPSRDAYSYPACDTCWRVHRRRWLPPTDLTRQNRRLRWAIRCLLHKKPVTHIQTGRHGKLEGDCPDCWQRGLVAEAWIRAFDMRRTLVRRNTQGELRKSLLKWVWDTEQDRGNRTWRQWPDPPRGPDGGGGTRLPARAMGGPARRPGGERRMRSARPPRVASRITDVE